MQRRGWKRQRESMRHGFGRKKKESWDFFDGRRGWVREKKDEWFFSRGSHLSIQDMVLYIVIYSLHFKL